MAPIDFEQIPRIIQNPDDMQFLPADHRHSKPVIQYTKRINGWVYVLEEMRKGHQTLAMKTMYKTKTDPAKKQK